MGLLLIGKMFRINKTLACTSIRLFSHLIGTKKDQLLLA